MGLEWVATKIHGLSRKIAASLTTMKSIKMFTLDYNFYSVFFLQTGSKGLSQLKVFQKSRDVKVSGSE